MGGSFSNRRKMAAVEVGQYVYCGVTMMFCTGNIAEVEGDIVLVSSDVDMTMSFGAARAINHTGGEEFMDAMEAAIEVYHGVGTLTVDTADVHALPYDKVMVIPIRNRNRNSMRTLYREALKALIDSNEEMCVMPMIGCGGFRLDKMQAAREMYEAIRTFTTFRNMKTLKFVDLSRYTMQNLYEACADLEGLVIPDLAPEHDVRPQPVVVIPSLPSQPRASGSNDDIQIVMDGVNPRARDVIIPDGNVPMPSRWIANDVEVVSITAPKQDEEQTMTKEALERIYSEVDRATIETEGTGSQNPCSICLNELASSCGEGFDNQPLTADPVVQLKLCPHQFHKSCIDSCLKIKKQCPLCMRWYALSFGTQPKNATMRSKRIPGNPPGHPKADGWFKITYTIPSGIQTVNHIRPGEPYSGTTRSTYLPNDEGGRLIHRLLKKAFEYRHTFTVGDSITSGQQNVPVWVLHHKTSMTGGSANYGYPDPEYYDRVKQELEQFGITQEILDD